MTATAPDYTLAELCIVACAEAWRNDGEVLATGIGLVPRLAAGLAKLTFNQDLMMTDAESVLVAEPVPVGPRGNYQVKVEGWMPYLRTFDLLWHGRRHALVGPVQVDRFGQMNISAVGEHAKPKASLLGVRGFPGNTLNHPNSLFIPNHGPRVFVAGEVDVVCSIGYNPARWREARGPRPASVRHRPRGARLRRSGPRPAGGVLAPRRHAGAGAGCHGLPVVCGRHAPGNARTDGRTAGNHSHPAGPA